MRKILDAKPSNLGVPWGTLSLDKPKLSQVDIPNGGISWVVLFSSAFIYGLCKTLPTCRVDVQSWQDLDGNCTQIVWILQHPNITFESDYRMGAWFTIGEAIGCDSCGVPCIFSGLPLKRTQGWLPFSYNKRKAEGIANLLIGRKIRLGCRPIYYCIFRPEIWLDLTILVARLHQHVAWPGYMQNPTSITVKPESQTAGRTGQLQTQRRIPTEGLGWNRMGLLFPKLPDFTWTTGIAD